MAKDKKPRQKDAIKRAALKREQHMRLVNGRSGDARYVQRERRADGSVMVTMPTEHRDEFAAAMEQQKVAFREKFGREMGPEDPIFFDPNADTPQPFSEETTRQMQADLVQAAVAAGLDPAYILAFNEVGYMPTEDTQHTFTAHELEAYEQAVERHQQAAR